MFDTVIAFELFCYILFAIKNIIKNGKKKKVLEKSFNPLQTQTIELFPKLHYKILTFVIAIKLFFDIYFICLHDCYL